MRKSLYDISWQVPESEYRESKALSYSTIARFNREGFDNLTSLFTKIDSPSLLFGRIVDTLLTGTKQEFEDTFIVASFPNIGDKIVQIVKTLHTMYSTVYTSLDTIPAEKLLQQIDLAEFQQNWKKPESKINAIIEKGSEYYNLLTLSEGKQLINSEDYQNALNCVATLRTENATKWYFAENNPFDPDIERFYQLKFKGSYNNIPLRCMADLIIVDHKNKTILPVDLKTSFKKEWNFYNSFIAWNYWIQAQLYWEIINQNILRDDYFKSFKLLDYQFIVINKLNLVPLVWTYTDTTKTTDCYYGKNNNICCKNWRNIVPILNYYLTQNPIYPDKIKENNNIIEWLNHE